MPRMTKLMQKVEDQFQTPLIPLIGKMVAECGLSEAAAAMGVSKATLGYWMLKLGIRVPKVALGPDETLVVVRDAHFLSMALRKWASQTDDHLDTIDVADRFFLLWWQQEDSKVGAPQPQLPLPETDRTTWTV